MIKFTVDRSQVMEAIKEAAGEEIERLDMFGDMQAERARSLLERITPYRTGKLRENTGVRKTGRLQWQFYAETDYASFVEYGTRKMAARPFVRPAVALFVEGFGVLWSWEGLPWNWGMEE